MHWDLCARTAWRTDFPIQLVGFDFLYIFLNITFNNVLLG